MLGGQGPILGGQIPTCMVPKIGSEILKHNGVGSTFGNISIDDESSRGPQSVMFYHIYMNNIAYHHHHLLR